MVRRMAPDARRAEILRRTEELVAQQGPDGLSLREVARWCGMSAPGILHHFDGFGALLVEMLAARDARELAAVDEDMRGLGDRATLRDFADVLVRHVAAHPQESRNFDALESEAVATSSHPAHGYFVVRIPRPLPQAVVLARREYADPEAVLRVLDVIADGLRHRWLRFPGVPDYAGDWEQIRDTVFAGFEHLRL